jgi:ferredoxin
MHRHITICAIQERETNMAKAVYVDQNECTGCNLCVDTCPEVFRMTENDVAEAFDPTGADESKIQECIDNCPVTCIQWKE